MKFIALKVVFSLFLGIMSNTSIGATLFNRADFGANAIEFGFDTHVGDIDPTDGNFTAQGGEVRGAGDTNFSNQGITDPLAYLSPDSDPFLFTFANPVSAIGFNFAFSEEASYALAVIDASNTLFGAVFLDPNNFDSCTGTTFFVCGFIGINAGSNQIFGAGFINQGTLTFGTVIDNVIYETVPTTVPTPGILWLLSTGFLGLYWNRKQKFS